MSSNPSRPALAVAVCLKVARAVARHFPGLAPGDGLGRIGSGLQGDFWFVRTAVGTLRALKKVGRSSFSNVHPCEREFSSRLKFEPMSRPHEGLMNMLQVGRNDAEGYFYYA